MENGNEDRAILYIDSLKMANSDSYSQHKEFHLRCRGIYELKKNNFTAAFKLFSDGLKLAKKKKNSILVY